MKWLAGIFVVALLSGGATVLYQQLRTKGSAEQVTADYFGAWELGGFARMAELADDPPADFGEIHRSFSRRLQVQSLSLKRGSVTSDGEKAAHVDFTATRDLPSGKWEVRSTLRAAVVDRAWKILWTPQTLLPGVKKIETVELAQTPSVPPTPVARDGRELPGASVQGYFVKLVQNYGDEKEGGWVIKADGKPLQPLGDTGAKLRTTIDRKVQKAADAALKGAAKPAAVIALRPSTGEILAVSDKLQEGGGAFHGLYPPGSTFKVVTAAALLNAGVSPSSRVGCPAKQVIGGVRTIPNHDNLDLGSTTFRAAFAHSCNTTFAELAFRKAKAPGLKVAAEMFGFGRPFALNAARPSFPDVQNDAELAEAAIGQGRVQATPLNMAAVAAAVADGTWRSPRMLAPKVYEKAGEQIPASRPLPSGLVGQLRTLMRATVTEGTAARAGLPAGTAGKTGTAEWNDRGSSHAWFIGYRGDLAFCVFVHDGGSGADAAVPLTARFLKGAA